MASDSISGFISYVSQKIGFPGFELFHSFLERIHKRMSQVGEAAGSMKSGVVVAVEAIGSALENSKFFQFLGAVWKLVTSIGVAAGKLASGAIDKLIKTIGNANFDSFLIL